MMSHPVVRIGVVGAGYISSHFVMSLDRHQGYEAGCVLTRRPVDQVKGFPRPELLTTSVNQMIDNCDVVLECTGDAVYATEIIDQATRAGLPVVTMNTEFHVTTGSYFVGRGLISEAEGDQPGCQAALKREALELGFEPLVYGNLKGFLNQNPTVEDMTFWGNKNGISLPMVTSFTDGTKVQAEQVLVANGLGATIARRGLVGPATDSLQEGGDELARMADQLGQPVSDYILSSKLPHGVFIVGRHDQRQKGSLRYLKLGEGPYYVLLKHNIFVHLEILKTIKEVVHQGRVLLDNSVCPVASVATIAKRDLMPGHKIEQGIGSFDVRGEAALIADHAGHVPIGLMSQATIRRPVKRGNVLTMDDVDLPDSLAVRAWREIEARSLRRHAMPLAEAV